MSSKPNSGLGAAGALARAWRAMAAHPAVTLVAVALYAAAFVPLHFIGESIDSAPGAMQSQAALVKLVLYQMGGLLAVTALVGPVFSAFAVYAGKRQSEGDPGTLYGAANFALARYARIFFWYLVVQISVQIGLQLVVLPGILFFQMYAFVVPVICMEKESWPMDRSKRLTTGRRRTIFLLLLPWLLIYVGFGIMDLFGWIHAGVARLTGQQDPSNAVMALSWFVIEGLRSFYEFWMAVALFFLYDDRIKRILEARAARAAEATAGAGTAG